MKTSREFLSAAKKALHDRSDTKLALSYVRKILEYHSDGEEAEEARILFHKLAPGTPLPQKKEIQERERPSDEIYTEEQWRAAGDESAAHKTKVETSYVTARGVAGFIEIIGWIAVVGGIFVAAIAAGREVGPIGFLAGFIVMFSGLITIMGAQVVKATVDTADHTRAILNAINAKVGS